MADDIPDGVKAAVESIKAGMSGVVAGIGATAGALKQVSGAAAAADAQEDQLIQKREQSEKRGRAYNDSEVPGLQEGYAVPPLLGDGGKPRPPAKPQRRL